MKPIKAIFKFALFCFFFWGTYRLCKSQTSGFSHMLIETTAPYAASYTLTPPLSPELQQALQQPFHYLGKGGQSYVFLSADETIVLKFFRKTHVIPDSFIHALDTLLPASLHPLRVRVLATREERFTPLFESCELAYEHLSQESGLLYAHLGSSASLPSVHITDRLGIEHTVDLNHTPFVLQKKVTLLFPHLKALLKENKQEELKASLHHLLTHLATRCTYGIRDKDRGLKRNYGFLGNTSISLDVGSFILDPTLKKRCIARLELEAKTKRLRAWIHAHAPELLPFFEKEMDQAVELIEEAW